MCKPTGRRVQWKLREIMRERDSIFTLFYDTPDGAREVSEIY